MDLSKARKVIDAICDAPNYLVTAFYALKKHQGTVLIPLAIKLVESDACIVFVYWKKQYVTWKVYIHPDKETEFGFHFGHYHQEQYTDARDDFIKRN